MKILQKGFFVFVPRTDTGALGEKPQTYRVKLRAREFGKLAP